jgi:hypothetical protein
MARRVESIGYYGRRSLPGSLIIHWQKQEKELKNGAMYAAVFCT